MPDNNRRNFGGRRDDRRPRSSNRQSGYNAPKEPDAARRLALEVLEQVERDEAFANLVLPRALRAEQSSNRRFDFRDAAFVSELVYGTIRQQRYLDTVVAHFCSTPLADLDPEVLQILRLGAYQLLFMRVPDHAAVSETVNLARSRTTDGPTRLVNAILRSITRADEQQISDIFAALQGQDEELSARYSHPEWMTAEFRRALTERGFPEDELPQLLAANNATPKVNLVARPGLIDALALAEEAEEVLERASSQGQLSEYAVIIDGGDPAALPAVRSGCAAVQDEGSQLAALLLAEAPLSGPDERWLDLCAGPGGKAALLAALAAKRGAAVTANEVSPHRARLVERSVRALDNVTVTVADGRTLPAPDDGPFDRVLVDAPCSGLGSLRRRPESRWRHLPSDVDELVPLQRGLLQRAIELTRPGGVIAWVTCTPQVEETLGQVEWALGEGRVELLDAIELAEQHTPLEIRPAAAAEAPLGDLAEKTVQLWPHRHGSDAMFVALLRKKD